MEGLWVPCEEWKGIVDVDASPDEAAYMAGEAVGSVQLEVRVCVCVCMYERRFMCAICV
jgi:hypothetical protein